MSNPLTYARIRKWIEEEANFFRLHLLFFLLVPLIAGAIFYAVNGKYPVSFLDSLFLCYSALTVTGLSVVNLSTITVFQQVILFVLMICGDVTVIAWIMVLVRKRYFRQHVTEIHKRKTTLAKIGSRFAALLYGATGREIPPAPQIQLQPNSQSTGGSFGRSAKPERIQAGEGIGAAIVGGAGTGLGLGVALGGRRVNADNGAIEDLNNGKAHDSPSLRSHRSSASSHIHIAVESSARLSPSTDFTMNIDGDEHGVIADVHSFTSSPRSGASPSPSRQPLHARRIRHSSRIRKRWPRAGVVPVYPFPPADYDRAA
ncbi:hypothetical protein A0H81_00278 [Grifola frondosa]|uniref:Uncharacterized protein n=1 Tax=Grifola frondosa TaxID=5627 RepID=A0A1C7MUQ9_GRIFR|nr:hypothetical protein A0H81_00278 [Grifola frondosa]